MNKNCGWMLSVTLVIYIGMYIFLVVTYLKLFIKEREKGRKDFRCK